jgi:hypothetical protein
VLPSTHHATDVEPLLNGREWATVFWLAVFLVVLLVNRDLRTSLWGVTRTLLTPILLVPLLLMAAYASAVVYIAAALGLWQRDLIGGTAVWYLTSAVALFFTITKIADDPRFMRRATRSAVGATILVEAFVNLYVFPLGVELFLIPFAILVAAMLALAEAMDQFANIRGPLRAVSSTVGFVLLINVVVRLLTTLTGGSLNHLAKSLALPVWLNLMVLPFIYVLGLYLVYQTAFVMLGFAPNATSQSVRRARVALLIGLRGRPYYLGDFGPPWPHRLNAADSYAEARRVVAELRHERDSLA